MIFDDWTIGVKTSRIVHLHYCIWRVFKKSLAYAQWMKSSRIWKFFSLCHRITGVLSWWECKFKHFIFFTDSRLVWKLCARWRANRSGLPMTVIPIQRLRFQVSSSFLQVRTAFFLNIFCRPKSFDPSQDSVEPCCSAGIEMATKIRSDLAFRTKVSNANTRWSIVQYSIVTKTDPGLREMKTFAQSTFPLPPSALTAMY